MNKIFLETSNKNSYECNLIRILLKLLGKEEGQDFEIVCVGGKDNLSKHEVKLAEHESDTEVNLIIFDADTPTTGGGYKKRAEELKQTLDLLNENSNRNEIFLFPNNEGDGALEDLLEQIINPEHCCIMEYFDTYEQSLASHKDTDGKDKYQTPDQKARMFAYISAFKKASTQREHLKKGDWMFDNPQFWDLNAAALQPLKNFLAHHLNTSETAEASHTTNKNPPA